MIARIRLGMFRMAHPRTVRILSFALMLALVLMSGASPVSADACPGGATSGTGCG